MDIDELRRELSVFKNREEKRKLDLQLQELRERDKGKILVKSNTMPKTYFLMKKEKAKNYLTNNSNG